MEVALSVIEEKFKKLDVLYGIKTVESVFQRCAATARRVADKDVCHKKIQKRFHASGFLGLITLAYIRPFSQRPDTPETQLLAFNFFQTVERCSITQRFFDTNQLVVFSNAVRTAHRSGFDLTSRCTYCQVSDGCIFSLA